MRSASDLLCPAFLLAIRSTIRQRAEMPVIWVFADAVPIAWSPERPRSLITIRLRPAISTMLLLWIVAGPL